MKKAIASALLVLAAFSASAHAGEVSLMKVRNAQTGVTYDFRGSTDDETGDLMGMNYYLPDGRKVYFSTEAMRKNPVFLKDSKYGVSKAITQSRGAKLDRSGGTLTLRVLRRYEILKKDDYRDLYLEVTRVGSNWKMFVSDNSGRHEYTMLLMYSNYDDEGEERGVGKIKVVKNSSTVEEIDTDDLDRE